MPIAAQLHAKQPLVLASASPRRKDLLQQLGLEFVVQVADVDESVLPQEQPAAHVQRLAEAKARAVQPLHPQSVVLAGDTVVVLNGAILGKPKDKTHAQQMLEQLSGNTHTVFSGYCLTDGKTGHTILRVETTQVHFHPLPQDWLHFYLNTEEGMDKAGAYAIQGLGAVMIRGIEGAYHNVVGFPVERIAWDLLEAGWVGMGPLPQ